MPPTSSASSGATQRPNPATQINLLRREKRSASTKRKRKQDLLRKRSRMGKWNRMRKWSRMGKWNRMGRLRKNTRWFSGSYSSHRFSTKARRCCPPGAKGPRKGRQGASAQLSPGRKQKSKLRPRARTRLSAIRSRLTSSITNLPNDILMLYNLTQMLIQHTMLIGNKKCLYLIANS